MQLPPGLDVMARYDAARGQPVRRVPAWRARRDSLHGQPNAAARMQARNMPWRRPWQLGAPSPMAWIDIQHFQGRVCFILSYMLYILPN